MWVLCANLLNVKMNWSDPQMVECTISCWGGPHQDNCRSYLGLQASICCTKGAAGPWSNVQLVACRSLSLSLVVKYIPLWSVIGSVVVPWNPPTVSLHLSLGRRLQYCELIWCPFSFPNHLDLLDNGGLSKLLSQLTKSIFILNPRPVKVLSSILSPLYH